MWAEQRLKSPGVSSLENRMLYYIPGQVAQAGGWGETAHHPRNQTPSKLEAKAKGKGKEEEVAEREASVHPA